MSCDHLIRDKYGKSYCTLAGAATRNNLGDPHHNLSMQVARDVLGLK